MVRFQLRKSMWLITREFKLQKLTINHIVVARITNTTDACYYIQYFVFTKKNENSENENLHL